MFILINRYFEFCMGDFGVDEYMWNKEMIFFFHQSVSEKILKNRTKTNISWYFTSVLIFLYFVMLFQAYLSLSSEQQSVKGISNSKEDASISSLEICKNMISAFNSFRGKDG